MTATLLILLRGVALHAAEPVLTDKLSQRIRNAVLDGLPAFDGQIYHAPLEKPVPAEISQIEVDAEVVVLPVLTIVDGTGAKQKLWSDRTLKPKTKPLVLGTGVTEFKFKKLKVEVPTLLFIPIGLVIDW